MRLLAVMLALLLAPAGAGAQAPAPWGTATEQAVDYPPEKVVYDVVSGDARGLEGVLDRVSYLSTLYNADPFESSIVVVLHTDVIHLFARKNFEQHRALMTRAQSLTVGTTIEFRMCQLAAQARGYQPADIHGFVQMVPMADAELVRLQRDEGYAYMQ